MCRRKSGIEESDEEYEPLGYASITDHISALNFLVDGNDW